MDDSQRSSTNCIFQNLTEKDFVTGLIRDFSRKLVKESNVWKNPPKDWPEKELGSWKCPTAYVKDNLNLMKNKLKYLRSQVPQSELSNADIQKLQYYDRGNMKAINEIIHSENSIDALKRVRNFLFTIKGGVPFIHENLTQLEMLLADLAPLLAKTCAKVKNSVSDSATVTNSRKRSCPTSTLPKVTPAKQKKTDPIAIAPKPSPAANLQSSYQSTTHIPNHQPHDSVGTTGLPDNIFKPATSSTLPTNFQGPQLILLYNPPLLINHSQDITHPDVSTEHDNPVHDPDTSSYPPPVSSPQHHSHVLPIQSLESPHEKSKAEPKRVTPIPCHIPLLAQYDDESRKQDDSCPQTSRSCSVDSDILSSISIGTPGIGTATERSCSVDSDILSSIGTPSNGTATERSCSVDSGIISEGTPSTATERSCSVNSGIISEGIHRTDTETTVASVGSGDDQGDVQFYENNLEGLDLSGILDNLETGDCSVAADLLSLFPE